MTNKRVIVAAACKSGDIVLVGVRHFDQFMQSQMGAIEDKNISWHRPDCLQGFIDNEMNLLDRCKAWEVAKKSGQIKHLVDSDSIEISPLFSEDLW